MGTFRYALRDAFRLLGRHWGLALLTFVTATAVFFLVGGSALLMVNTSRLVTRVEGELVIHAFLKNEKGMEALQEKVRQYPGVVDVRMVTPQDALDRLRKSLQNQAQALEILGENPLPPSLEIRVDRAHEVPNVARELLTLSSVDDVVYPGTLASRLARDSQVVVEFSLVLLIIAVTASALVLFNTIRIAVYSKKEEISVMLLVGATPSFVAMPFVLQGMILGIAGAAGALGLLGGAYQALVGGLEHSVPFLEMVKDPDLLVRLGLILVGVGMTVGWVSSWLAVDRFIRRALRPM